MRFKARMKIWGIIIIGYFAICLLSNFFKFIFTDTRIKTNINVNVEEKYLNEIVVNRTEKLKTKDSSNLGLKSTMSINNTNSDIILTMGKEDIDNYKFYKKAMSPIVAFVNDEVKDDNSIFTKSIQVGKSNVERTIFSLDLGIVLKAMEDSKTWQDLGISEDLLEGLVTMTIPTMKEDIGPYVWQTIYDNFKTIYPNINEDVLIEKTNDIISKCTQSSNLSGEFYDIYQNDSKSKYYKTFYLIPEYLISTYEKTFNNISYSYTLFPVYFDNTNAIDYYIYLNENNEILKDIPEENIDELINKGLCLRVENSKYDFIQGKDAFQYRKKILNMEFLTKEQIEIINNHYFSNIGKINNSLQNNVKNKLEPENNVSSSNFSENETNSVKSEEKKEENNSKNVEEYKKEEKITKIEEDNENIKEENLDNEEQSSSNEETQAEETNEEETKGEDILLLLLCIFMIALVLLPLLIAIFDCFWY